MPGKRKMSHKYFTISVEAHLGVHSSSNFPPLHFISEFTHASSQDVYQLYVYPMAFKLSRYPGKGGKKKRKKKGGYYKQSFFTTTALYFEYTKVPGWLTLIHEAAWA